MSNRQRLIMFALAAVIAVVAFVALRPSGDEESSDEPTQAQTSTTTSPTEPRTPAEQPERPQPPATPTIRIRAGRPVGGVEKLKFEKGERVKFEVRSDAAHEVHVHGYDLSKQVPAGGSARFSFEAEIEGGFEIELEDLGEPIADLEVRP